jgi:hypothetical protein
MSKILIIGDSTSSALGGESHNWLRLLTSKKIWASNLEFIDTSAPGVTSGSAFATLIMKLLRTPFSYKVVILSVGNCDRIRRPYIANRVTVGKILRILINLIFSQSNRKVMKWPKLTLDEWNDVEPPLKDQSIENFTKSLRLIKFSCRSLRIPLIVILPQSNLYFSPATAANNTKFYSFLNHQDLEIPNSIGIIPNLLDHESISKSFEVNDQDFSEDLEVLASYSKERLLCAVNNLSVSTAKTGSINNSIEILRHLIQLNEIDREVFSYNLALLLLSQNLVDESNLHFELARDLDTSSYRVNRDYTLRAQKVFQNSRMVSVIDTSSQEFENDFLDHCHLLEKGQEKLAETISTLLSAPSLIGSMSAKLLISPASPEILEGDTRSFNEVFGITSEKPISISEIQPERSHALNCLETSQIGFAFSTRFIELLESAIFYSVTEIFNRETEFDIACEIQTERTRVKTLFDQLSIQSLVFDVWSLTTQTRESWLEAIITNVNNQIHSYLKNGVNCSRRFRFIMNWYFRESLYFGFNSSTNMAYERNHFRGWKEALSIAYVLDSEKAIHWERLNQTFRFVLEMESELRNTYVYSVELVQAPGTFADREKALADRFIKRWDQINGQ